jgi:hypothetical protein
MPEMVAVVAVVLIVIAVYMASNNASGFVESAFSGYFRGVRPDPWPHGVQEEYWDHQWGASASATGEAAPGSPLSARSQRRDSAMIETAPRATATPTSRVRVQVHRAH